MDGDAMVRGLIADGLDQDDVAQTAPALRHFAAACPKKEDAPAIRECVSPASFWQPQHIVPSAWHQHAPFAFWITEAVRPGIFVELGVHHGFSYLVFCQAVQRLELMTKCYAVDTWKGDVHAGFYGNDVFETLNDLHERHYSGFSRLIRSSFDEALNIGRLATDGVHALLTSTGSTRFAIREIYAELGRRVTTYLSEPRAELS
jgi:Methyltransferase domain